MESFYIFVNVYIFYLPSCFSATVFNIESSVTNVEIIGAQRKGVGIQKQMNDKLDPDTIEDLQDDIAEQQQIQEEIEGVMSQPLTVEEDEDDLWAMMEAEEEPEIEAEVKNEVNNVDAISNLPAGLYIYIYIFIYIYMYMHIIIYIIYIYIYIYI